MVERKDKELRGSSNGVMHLSLVSENLMPLSSREKESHTFAMYLIEFHVHNLMAHGNGKLNI